MLAALAVWAPSTRAQLEPKIEPESPHLMYPGVLVPSGGGLALTPNSGAFAVAVSPIDDETRTMPGSVVMLGQYIVWRAHEPLPLGEYWVQLGWEDLDKPSIYRIEVVAPLTGLPLVVAEPSLSLKSKGVESACCDQWENGELHKGADCFDTVYRDVVVLTPGLSTPEPTFVTAQFFFQLRATEPNDIVEHVRHWEALGSFDIDTQAERYCFSLDAIDIATGEVHALDVPGCAEHGALPALQEVRVDPSPAALSATHCHAPPLEYQETWCALNDDAFCEGIARPNETGCALRRYVCDGAPFPGTRDYFYLPQDAKDASVEAQPHDDDEAPAIEPHAPPSGCSAAPSARRATLAQLCLIALALYLACRRIAFARKPAMLRSQGAGCGAGVGSET